MKEVKRLSREFDDAVAARDAGGATEAVLELESVLHAWSADTFQSDELDRARAALRRMVVRLGETAVTGLRDPREVLAPWVEALLVERAEARESRRFPDADRIRGHLEAAGVEVRDTPAGTQWDLRGVPSP
jgi:cysteinyl-tRNA synthetase